MSWRDLNLFRKKSSIQIGDKPIYRSGFFSGFGSSVVKWNEIFTADQNNTLLINSFNQLAEVAAPVLKYSDGANQVIIKANIDEVQKLLNTPNYYQGGNEWFSQLILYKRLLGNSIVNIFTQLTATDGRKPTQLYNLSPQFIQIELDKKEKRDFRDDDIKKYIFDSKEHDRNIIEIEPKNILHLKEVNPNFKNTQYLFGESRYAGCSKNIQSIASGYGAKVNLYDDGPRLIITGKNQGEFTKIDNDDDVEDVQDKMKKYGLSKNKFKNLVTDLPLDVFNASLNVGQLKITENNQSDFDRLCDAQSINSKIFSKETKFEDAKAALSDFYNNAFRSEIDSTVKDLETKLQIWWPELELTTDYSQISEIVTANNQENKRLLEDTEKGLMTRNEYLIAIGQEKRTEKEFNQLYFLTGTGWVPLTQNTQSNE